MEIPARPPEELAALGSSRPEAATRGGPAAVDPAAWNDWQWQLRHALRTPAALRRVIRLTRSEEAAWPAVTEGLPAAVTPYVAAVIDPHDPADPWRRQVVPQVHEARVGPGEQCDPLAEDAHLVAPGLVHRYPDRALLLATNRCAVYCRFCTRRRRGGGRPQAITRRELQHSVRYLRHHPEVREVIVSGGDPLVLSDARLDAILAAVRQIPTVELVRLATRAPAVLPMRITSELCAMLRRHQPLWVSTHFNHPAELTEEARTACVRLADAGVPVVNQTVLLRGVNDQPQVILDLCRRLVASRVRPCYLHQCDLVTGVAHFRTPVGVGIAIMEHLRGRLSGYAIPTLVIDTPGGGGKVPVGPDYVVGRGPGAVVLRNYEGRTFRYIETDGAGLGYTDPA